MHEAQGWETKYMATFTYDKKHLPRYGSLTYRHHQLLLKQLRRRKGQGPFRFFCAGEYGGRFQRPHFHTVLFGTELPDVQRWMNNSFHSAKLQEVWGKGNVQLDELNVTTAAYVARYTTRKANKENFTWHIYENGREVGVRARETVRMSKGIGRTWYERWANDLFPSDFAVINGKRSKVPRYYWKKAQEALAPELVNEIVALRTERAMARIEDHTAERLAVREELAERNSQYWYDIGNHEW